MVNKVFESFLIITGFAIHIYIIFWLLRLETIGCVCSLDWRRHFIIFYAFFHLVLAATAMSGLNMPSLRLLSFVLSIVNVVVTIEYVHKLKTEKCACSESVAREVIYIAAFINMGIIAFLVLQTAVFGTGVNLDVSTIYDRSKIPSK